MTFVSASHLRLSYHMSRLRCTNGNARPGTDPACLRKPCCPPTYWRKRLCVDTLSIAVTKCIIVFAVSDSAWHSSSSSGSTQT